MVRAMDWVTDWVWPLAWDWLTAPVLEMGRLGVLE
jgi:hypothetical protein